MRTVKHGSFFHRLLEISYFMEGDRRPEELLACEFWWRVCTGWMYIPIKIVLAPILFLGLVGFFVAVALHEWVSNRMPKPSCPLGRVKIGE